MSDVADRFSSLPDSIIHHIFSFLETKVVVQTIILSKRWRHLWSSCPYLYFYYDANSFELLDFVDRVLILRDASSIQKFTLICEEMVHKTRVFTWLLATLKRHVKELDLVLVVDQPVEFPYHLFTSDVKVLTLSGNYGEVHIRMPHSMCSANKIKSLDLDFVKLPEGDCNGELLLSCSVLENLILSRCDIGHLKALTISAPQLKRVKLISAYEDPDFFCKINICSPSLTSLMCVCDTHWDCSLENLSALTDARLDIGGDETEKKAYDQCLMKILKGINNVKSLKLSARVFQAVAESPEVLKILPDLFHNLRDVTLEVGDDSFMFLNRAIANLLKALPCIETFALKRYEDMALNLDEIREDWGEGLPVHCKFHSLKMVKIHNSFGMEDELKFLEFILDRAIFLEELFITSTQKEMEKFSEKLATLPRASSNVLVHLHSSVEACLR